MTLPPFPRRHPAPPETIEECDEAIAYWSAMAEMTGLPVIEQDGGSTVDRLLELRASLPKESQKLTITIERDEACLWVASVADLPGCHTQGKTLAEALERIGEAIELVQTP